MDKKKLYESALSQAAIWGTGSYLAHKASQMVDRHQTKQLHKIKPLTKKEKEISDAESKLKKRSDMVKGIASTLAGAGAGYAGAKM